MKKFFFFCMMALVAMCGLNSCSEDCDHDFVEVDYSNALVGTWTCLEQDYAEAMVIKADGSLEVTGLVDGEFFESKGSIKVVNNKMIYKLDNGDEFEGLFEIIPGESFSMVIDNELDYRFTYRYCENDLSDEIIGTWVSNEGLPGVENDMAIQTFSKDGKMTMTTQTSEFIDKDLVNVVSDYKVIGNLLFVLPPKDNVAEGVTPYLANLLTYTPNGTSLGDILTQKSYFAFNNGEVIYSTGTFVRVKQELNLTGKMYAYSSAYVTNAKGKDEDFSILGQTFNMAKIKAGDFDIFFRSELFCVELNANSIKQHFLSNGQDIEIEIPIIVEGNKVTLDLSSEIPVCRKVEMYMFQDADDSQLHMHMPTSSFINYFANMELYALIAEGKINPADAAAAEKVFADMEARIESINVSFVMKAIEVVK